MPLSRKRNDARLIVLALIVNTEGFLKYSDIFQGNTTDSQTLKMVIEKLDSKVGYMQKKPTIVMDAGIATDANIAWLKSKQYDYLCVSRSNLKEYKADTYNGPVQIYDTYTSFNPYFAGCNSGSRIHICIYLLLR